MTTEIRLDVPRGHYRPKHIARSELAKIETLRSTAITVGLTVVVTDQAGHMLKLPARSDNALDVYYHPFVYAAPSALEDAA